MSKEKTMNVTMRVRIGESEIEVTGLSNYVEKKVAEFLEKQNQVFVPSGVGSSKSTTLPATHMPASSKVMSIAQFFKKISPKSDVDRVLVAGYFLEKSKSQDNFTASEVSETIRSAKIPPPKNPNHSINQNIRKGHMMPSGDKEGKMAFVLTSDGEEVITELLKA
ncbi:MAG: hypothetical protein HZB82_06290 [Deltaproteobacteria bacterium]|nr:hypothetical protein [Deltaproteobacteria bacterium]